MGYDIHVSIFLQLFVHCVRRGLFGLVSSQWWLQLGRLLSTSILLHVCIRVLRSRGFVCFTRSARVIERVGKLAMKAPMPRPS